MNKVFFFTVAFVAVVLSQDVNNLRFNTAPITITPGVPVTTSFYQQVGSQFKLWVPSNASQINIVWSRSAANDQCHSASYAYLYGKWATYPCTWYYGLNSPCNDEYANFGYAASSSNMFSLNAFDAEDLEYWARGTYGDDFIRGDYLYLTSYLDLDYNCTATLTASIDYCPAGTIAADEGCVPYTNVGSSNYYANGTSVTGPSAKYYLLNLPDNVSGVSFTVTSFSSPYVYLFGRERSGGSYYNNYEYNTGYGNVTLWIPNPAAGEFVLSIQPTGFETYVFDVQIEVQTCPYGLAADRNGACLYPLTQVNSSYLASYPTVFVPPYNPSVNTDCNWVFLAYTVAPETWRFMNLSIWGVSGYMYWRRNAVPNDYHYDDYEYSGNVINFTPEDFYASKPVTYYFGFCNYDYTNYANFTIHADFQYPAPSPSPSASPSSWPSASPSSHPSSSPSSVPSVSPSSTPDSDSSSDGPEPSEGVYILLLVVGFLLGVIVGLILGFYLYSKLQAKKQQQASMGYVPLQPFPVQPGMMPVQVPMYPTMN